MKYQNILDGKTQCSVCPRQCILKNGQRGFCHVRQNIDGNIVLTSYGFNTGLAVDPIEKKPLYHFLPSSRILSFGTIGCNLGCQFCQNWQTSKATVDPQRLNKVSPQVIAQLALKHNCQSVAFTYNEPTIFLEYAIDTAIECKKLGIKTVAVSAGYINPEPRAELFKYIDAVNIDLKAFNNDFYKRNCLASIEPVLDTLKYIKNETNTWLEVTTLLIEGENDSDEELNPQCEWIVENLGDCVPLHFSAFRPHFKFHDRPTTHIDTLKKARSIALSKGLKYVYAGNVANPDTSTTYCKNCGEKLIVRNGFFVQKNNLKDGNICPNCEIICDGILLQH